jgi:hypothetical protein
MQSSNAIHFSSTQNIQHLNSIEHNTMPHHQIRYNTIQNNAMQHNTTWHDTTQYYLSMTDYYTVLHCTALCPSTAISILLFLPLSMTPCSIASQPQPQLTLAPAPTRRYSTWCSLHDGTLSMHTFFFVFFFFDNSTGCFFLFALLRCVSFRLVLSCFVSPRLAPPLLVCFVWLWLLLLLFASLLFPIPFHSVLFHRILVQTATSSTTQPTATT